MKPAFSTSETGFFPELIATEDGSISIRDRETGELYHNRAGAYTEALLNYVQPAGAPARLQSNSEVRVLDVCFGLGYNSFVLLQEAINAGSKGLLQIHAVEPDSAVLGLIPQVMEHRSFKTLSNLLPLEKISAGKSFRVEYGDLQICFSFDLRTLQLSLPEIVGPFDYVFHDPFSPKRRAELWTLDIFRCYFEFLRARRGAVLTYSSASAVRGGLSEAGFAVMKTSAVGGKSGGTIAFCQPCSSHFNCCELSAEEHKRLTGSSGTPYRDPEMNFNRQEILRRRDTEIRAAGYKD